MEQQGALGRQQRAESASWPKYSAHKECLGRHRLLLGDFVIICSCLLESSSATCRNEGLSLCPLGHLSLLFTCLPSSMRRPLFAYLHAIQSPTHDTDSGYTPDKRYFRYRQPDNYFDDKPSIGLEYASVGDQECHTKKKPTSESNGHSHEYPNHHEERRSNEPCCPADERTEEACEPVPKELREGRAYHRDG